MNKKLIPSYLAKDIYSIDPSFYLSIGVKAILSDLDNTLANYRVNEPDERTRELVRRVKDAGLCFYIVSNNTSKRVSDFASSLGVPYYSGMLKPFASGMRKFLKREGLKESEVILVGDQVYTDVLCGGNSGVRTVLTEPITAKDSPFTFFNRMRERRIRKKIALEGLSKHI